jgi:hypothetical protein
MPKRLITQPTTPEAAVNYILKDTDSPHVVIGPTVWHASNPEQKYFIVATSEAGRGFRCDRLDVRGDNDRTRFLRALFKRRAIVVHDCEDADEVYTARLCEMLWPGERISKLRAAVEAENASWRVH